MSFRSLLSALALATLSALPASAYQAVNGLTVQGDETGGFFVPYRGLSGDPAFWCAAGDYVLNFLDLPSGTRIFRISEPPRRSGQGIQFSLLPEGAASRTGLNVITSGPTGSISATTAFALCPPRFRFLFGNSGFIFN
jgi:hypothetical protein